MLDTLLGSADNSNMKRAETPTILIIVGITGDLSRRKLLPAIEQIVSAQAAPKQLRIIGVTRQTITINDIVKQVKSTGDHAFLRMHTELFQMDLVNPDDYHRLKKHLSAIEKEWGQKAQRLFYLSVPPQVSRPIVELLGECGLSGKNTKLLLEKPFGSDLISAQELVDETKQHFGEDQLYRIDHYLAKEMAQNFIIFRRGNSLFKRTWNKDFIERIEITASEKIDIEGRSLFYEQTGALRDVVQSHLLQLAALCLMATPKDPELHDVPELRRAALKQLRLSPSVPLETSAIRGQYAGYREEANNPDSIVETYTDITFESTDPRWEGVPIRIISGKALAEKSTRIRIVYKKDEAYESDELVLMLQPNEGVELMLWTKVPGYDWSVEKHSLRLAFKDHFEQLPEAYERVFLDAINADHTLFASSEEVLETWRIIQPLQQAWELSGHDLRQYKKGSLAGSI